MKTSKRMALAGLIAGSALFTSAAITSAQAGEWGGGYGGCHKEGRGGAGWAGEGYRGHEYAGGYAKQHGVKFSHGYFYVGKVQKHFTEKWYDRSNETYLYWDPHARSPYYWCEAHGVYYPIRYIEKVGPDTKGPGPVAGKGGPAVAVPVVAPAGGASVGGSAGVAPSSGGPLGPASGSPVSGGQPNGGQSGGGQPNRGPAGVSPQQGGTPAQPDSAAPAAVAKNGGQAAAKTEAQKAPVGTFDDAVPADLN